LIRFKKALKEEMNFVQELMKAGVTRVIKNYCLGDYIDEDGKRYEDC